MTYELEPFVIKPGEILTKPFILKNSFNVKVNDSEAVVSLTIVTDQKREPFNLCLVLTTVTPDGETKEAEVPLNEYFFDSLPMDKVGRLKARALTSRYNPASLR